MIITSVKGNRVSWPVQTTKNAYANLGAPWDKEHLKTCTFIIKNTGATNAAQIKVLGSVDSVNSMRYRRREGPGSRCNRGG